MAYDALFHSLQTVLSLFYLIWLYSWAKKYLGSAKLAILFAVIVVYLTFYQFPELIWVPVVFFILAVAGFFNYLKTYANRRIERDSKADYLRD